MMLDYERGREVKNQGRSDYVICERSLTMVEITGSIW